jgi:Stage II sporulation protein E (SpoIIE)
MPSRRPEDESEPRAAGSESRTLGDADAAVEGEEGREAGARWPYWLPLGTLLVGLLATALLAFGSAEQFQSNENRLLKLRVRDAGSLLTEALPDIQGSLAAAAELAGATHGDVKRFRAFIAPLVGAAPAHQFISVSLWHTSQPQRGPIAVVGVAPKLAAGSPAAAFFAGAARSPKLSVVGMLKEPGPRLGYAVISPAGGGFAAYGESAIPPDRRARIASNSAFSDLDYVIYLGASQRPQNLLVTSVSRLPFTGRHAADTVPFGSSALTLVMSPREPLSGTLSEWLPWIIAGGGLLITLAFTAVAVSITNRRRGAEQLASENRRLYGEQRGIAQTLQHALLPERLPEISGMQVSARYEAGERGVDIGGDWYDLIALDDRHALAVVGDVSGRGLRAGTTMASLRYAIRSYAAQNDSPATILRKLSDLLSTADDHQLATVLCVGLDTGRREITITSAGHLPPLLIADGSSEYVRADVGLPVGVRAGVSYSPTTVSVPPGATLLAFTDGLVELRGVSIDEGLARLREAAANDGSDLTEMLGRLLSEVRPEGAEDDIAILGLRWLG